MSKTWVIADPHFGHRNSLTFLKADGSRLRPFSSVEEMDGVMAARWNERVGDQDRIYVLGDVAMHHRNLSILHQLKGRKVLVRGNHDMAKLSQYAQYFQDVRAIVVKRGFALTHVPVHPDCLARWGINIHGHTHANRILDPKWGKPDPRYICVSVEQNDFAPVDLQDILDGRFK